jgi:ABC-type cobalamin/Fe3+-siderophores transport system ATPase subunit
MESTRRMMHGTSSAPPRRPGVDPPCRGDPDLARRWSKGERRRCLRVSVESLEKLTAVMGPSGSGKSPSCTCSWTRPSSAGEVWIDGVHQDLNDTELTRSAAASASSFSSSTRCQCDGTGHPRCHSTGWGPTPTARQLSKMGRRSSAPSSGRVVGRRAAAGAIARAQVGDREFMFAGEPRASAQGAATCSAAAVVEDTGGRR